jgi:hypothetical protein
MMCDAPKRLPTSGQVARSVPPPEWRFFRFKIKKMEVITWNSFLLRHDLSTLVIALARA